MAKKIIKKVDCKKVAKIEVNTQIKELFEGLGLEVFDGVEYGFTSGTLVLKSEKCDIQIKLIAPKAGIDRYEKLVDEEEEIVEENATSETEKTEQLNENIVE